MSVALVLLGAGSSLPAGFPSTEELTERVCSRPSDNKPINVFQRSADSLVNAFIRRLRAEVERYFLSYSDPGKAPNYEELYYLASQIADSEMGELDNPGLGAFIRELLSELAGPIHDLHISGLANLEEVADKAVQHIHNIVWKSLRQEPSCTKHLAPLLHLCQSECFTRIGIATLCHDAHVEGFLTSKGVQLGDGFSVPENGVRYWDPASLWQDTTSPLLMKLHGSVDWFRLRPDDGDWYDERIGIPLNGDYNRTRNAEGVFQSPHPPRPLILVGTFNKISDYSRAPFLHLYYRLRTFLSAADAIVICGYSFGDKGINTALLEWFYERRNRKIFVIHREPEQLVQHARGAIANKWKDWRNSGHVTEIRKWIQDLDPQELVTSLTALTP